MKTTMNRIRMQKRAPNAPRARVAQVATLALLLSPLAACSNGGGGGGGGGPATPAVVTETAAENDSAATAQALGLVGVGTAVAVSGEVSGFGTDQFDNYRIEASADIEVAVALAPGAGASGDLDLWIADERGAVRLVLDSDADETDRFTLAAGELATLVVTGFDDLPYELTLSGSAAP